MDVSPREHYALQSAEAGTVTFLLTDVEGSSRRWLEEVEEMRAKIQHHDEVLTAAVEAAGGRVLTSRGEGDSFFAIFRRASAAPAAALEIQQALQDDRAGLRVRMAIHTGDADDDLRGRAPNLCGRLRAVAHGGQVLLSSTTAALVRDGLPPEASLLDLGEHLLRDQQGPLRIYQLIHPSLPQSFPPLRTAPKGQHNLPGSLTPTNLPHELTTFPPLRTQERRKSNLPLRLTRFVGRVREIEQVTDLLSRSSLVTITGAGGIGKTRLALQVASRLVDAYEDGVWLVELASLTDPDLVPQAVMAVLDFRDQPGGESLDTLALNLADRQSLLVLDTCEHLIAPLARLAERLLQACPRLHILATSREVLGIDGEVPWRVPSLSMPRLDPLPSLEELVEYEAVALFADRASATGGFQVTAETAPALVEVCQRLDGMPLAIELAAARLKILSVTQVRDRLSDRFGLLTGANRAALPRQRTLRATIDWSYQLLSLPEQELLCRLSVFAGGCSVEAVEAVCVGGAVAADSILDLLAGLVDKSLVMVEPIPSSHRYRLLDTIREYAREEQAAASDGDVVHERHLEWCLALAVKAQPALHGPDQLTWLNRIDIELDNIRAALDWSCACQDRRAMLLASRLHMFWNMRGYMREGHERLRSVLSVDPEPTVDRAEALTCAGQLTGHSAGDNAEARELYLESLRIRKQLGTRRGLGLTLTCLGGAEIGLGNITESLRCLNTAVAESRVEGAPWQLAVALCDCANTRYYLHQPGPETREMLQESIVLLRQLGDDWTLGFPLDVLALVELDGGHVADARRLWNECGDIARRLDDKLSGSAAIHGMGRIAVKNASYARGLRLHSAAARLLREAGKSLMPIEQDALDASITEARDALGQVEADAASAAGKDMTLQEALDYALAESPV
jgi:predicted ATPase/class 3 adenylate cyclase